MSEPTLPIDLEAQVGNGTDTLRDALQQKRNPLLTTRQTFNLIDSDDAASDGTAVFVVAQGYGPVVALFSPLAGTSDITVATEEGADSIPVYYSADPAATLGGVALTFDEDGEGLGFNNPAAFDCYVSTVNGRLVKVSHATSGGVAVYCDDDATPADNRFLFVSPTNTSGSQQTDADKALFHETVAA